MQPTPIMIDSGYSPSQKGLLKFLSPGLTTLRPKSMSEVELVNHFSTNKKKLLLGILTTFLLANILLALAEGRVRVRAWFKYGSARHFESLYYFDND